MLSNVNSYNLVIYSDEESCRPLTKYLSNPRIRLIVKPYEEFYGYRYKDDWIKNHETNDLMNRTVDWKVNMLWSEKIHFVDQTIREQYFNSEFYGWCDIGYFRATPRDLSVDELKNWGSTVAIRKLQKDKIYYALVNNDDEYINAAYRRINDKNEHGLPKMPTPAFQISIAGGFFVCHRDNIDWWKRVYDEKLRLYFQHGYLVKDDQHIILDCVFSNSSRFFLCRENNPAYDNWFLFQRFLR